MNESSSTPERRVRQGMDYAEPDDVHQQHAAIQREKIEPRMGLEPLSLDHLEDLSKVAFDPDIWTWTSERDPTE